MKPEDLKRVPVGGWWDEFRSFTEGTSTVWRSGGIVGVFPEDIAHQIVGSVNFALCMKEIESHDVGSSSVASGWPVSDDAEFWLDYSRVTNK